MRRGILQRGAWAVIAAMSACAQPEAQEERGGPGSLCQQGLDCGEGLYCGCASRGCEAWVCQGLPGQGGAQGSDDDSAPAPADNSGQGAGPAPDGSGEPPRPRSGRWPASLRDAQGIDWSAFPLRWRDQGKTARRTLWVSASEGDDGAGDGTQGAPWASIRKAIGQAEAGDRILVRGGVYAEGPEGEYIALELGERSSGVSISAYEGEEVKVVPSRDGINYGLSLWGDNIEVEGLDFEGFPYAGVIVGQAGRTPRGVVLADAVLRFAPGRHREGVAIVPDNGGVPVVQGVLLSGIRVEGASIGVQCNTGPCNDLRMEGISVVGTGEEGTSSLDGIAVESGDNVVLLDVEVTQAGSDGIDLKATRVGVFGARVTRVTRNGIKLWRGGDLVNAVVSHTGADTALGFSEGGRYRILHTVVAYHHFQGPSAYSLTVGYGIGGEYDVEIQNCVFFRNSGGLYLPPNARLKVANNLFAEIDNRTALTFTRDGGELMMGLDALSDEATREALGGSNLVGLDPQVGDAEGDDFRPSAGSPLLGVGVQVEPSVEVDIDFAPRPQGGQPDIGPYEAP